MAKQKTEKVKVDSYESLMEAATKKFGKGALMLLGEQKVDEDFPVIPTGSPKLDAALGVGGYPRGRIVEIMGPEAGGKTTLTLHAIAEAQKLGGRAAFIDAEHALDVFYARKLGVDVDNLLISQPDSGEQALELLEMIVTSGSVDIAIVDSVAALVPRAELDGEIGDSLPGLQARLMSQAMRKLTGAISKSNTCVIFINQLRMKIGVMFGNPETTTGGNALKFYSSVRLDIRKKGAIKQGEDIIGNEVKIKVVKNKLAPPFKTVETEIIFGHGFNVEGEILDRAMILGIVDKAGAWFSYGETRIGQGRYAVIENLRKDKSLLQNILTDIKLEEENEDN